MSQPSFNKDFLPAIHAFRGLAALLVVAHHAYRSLSQQSQTSHLAECFIGGAAGVQFFFVLSGFIIFYIHQRDHRTPAMAKRFLRKRLVRIYPIYWVVLIPVLFLLYLQPEFLPELSRSIWMTTENLLLFPTNGPRAVAVAWTLSHEMLFYSVFLVFFYGLKNIRVPLVIWGISIALFQILQRSGADLRLNYWVDFVFDINNLFFIFGVFSCQVYRYLDASKNNAFVVRSCAGLAVGGTLLFLLTLTWSNRLGFERDYDAWQFVWERFLFALASVALICSEPLLGSYSFIRSRIFRVLGDASYSIYLCHGLVQVFLVKLICYVGWDWPQEEVSLAILVIFPTVIGFALHYGAERPLLNFFGKKLRPKFEKN